MNVSPHPPCVSPDDAGAACPEIPGAAPRQGAPPRADRLRVSVTAQHPSGRCGTVRDRGRFTGANGQVCSNETEGRASSARGASLDGRLKRGRSAGGTAR